jgi:hypothetical protein
MSCRRPLPVHSPPLIPTAPNSKGKISRRVSEREFQQLSNDAKDKLEVERFLSESTKKKRNTRRDDDEEKRTMKRGMHEDGNRQRN